jgi:antitoxin HigA-1
MSRLSGQHSVRGGSVSSAADARSGASKRLISAPPIGPGEVLRKHILAGSGITQEKLADAMQVSRFSVNQIVNGRRAVTAEMAVRLSRVTSTTPEFWLRLQRERDIYDAMLKIGDELSRLPVLRQEKSDAELFQDIGTE